MATAAARNSSRAESAPRRRSSDQPAQRRELGVLDRRQALERARRRQARVLVSLSAALVAASFLVVAAGHALLASDQVTADSLSSEIGAAVTTQQNDQLLRAQLEAPSRVLSIAENGLKMVTPPSVTYLVPVDPGPSVAVAHGAPATPASSTRRPPSHRAEQHTTPAAARPVRPSH